MTVGTEQTLCREKSTAMSTRTTTPRPPRPDWKPTPIKGPWREVSCGRWEHDAHGAIVQAVKVVDGGVEYAGWEVWTDKPHDVFRDLPDAKRAASQLGRFFPRSRPSREAAQATVSLADARRVADERLHTLIVDDDFNDNDSLPYSDLGCAVFTVHVQQAVDDLDPGRWIAEVVMPTDAVMWAEGAIRLDVRERAPGEGPRERPDVAALQAAVAAEVDAVSTASTRKWLRKMEQLAQRHGVVVRPYSKRDTFAAGDLVSHPQFGQGVVLEVLEGKKCAILFKEGRRILAMSS